MTDDRQVLPLSKEDFALWTGNLAKAREVRKTVQTWWDANLKQYAPAPSDDPDEYGSKLNTNRDFTLVERKKADLFYQRPDVTGIASPLFAGQEALIETHTTILNEKLGLDGVNAKDLVHRVLFDVLCPAGTGATVMGYENVSILVPMEQPMGEPPAEGALGLEAPPPVPQTVMQPSTVYEECFWRWLSPKQVLLPHDLRTTIWDDAPWLAFEFEMPVKAAKRKGWVPADYAGTAPSDETRFDHGLGNAAGDSVACGVFIYYKSALYRDDRPHPLHYTTLVLMAGQETPAVHQDSPYQTLDPQGMLTPDSLLGNCIHPLTIRTLTDSPYVPSDCTISRPLVNELNKFRGDMVEQRNANNMRWAYNVDVLPPDALAKIQRAPIGGMIGLPGDAYVGEGAIKELPHGTYPRENFSFNDYLDNDLARTHALDAEQSGASASGDQTATEANIKQSNVNARLGLERGIVLDWYVRGVTKYSQLLMRFLSVEQAAKIVGPQAAQQWDGWRKQVPASLAFTAMPNSTLRQDTAAELDRRMKHYTYWANDPFINRSELARETLKYLGYSAKVYQPQPPPKGPEPTKPGFSFKGDDLNPLNPQFPIVMAILQQSGVTVPPEVIQQAQAGAQNALLAQQVAGAQAGGPEGNNTAHGGKIAPMEGLDKHAAEQSGGTQGIGQTATGGSVM
jgi:hypothetical protein